jgi:type IV pilus assembly protein PilQ
MGSRGFHLWVKETTMSGFAQRRKMVSAGAIITAVVCVLSWSIAAEESGSSNQIRDVQVVEQQGKTTIVVVGSKRPSFTAFKLKSPERLVVDIANSQVRGVPSIIEKTTSTVRGVAVSQYSVKGVPVSRVMVNFQKDAAYRVRVKKNNLVVTLNGSPGRADKSLEGGASPETEKARKEALEAANLCDKANREAMNAKNFRDRAQKEALEAEQLRDKAQKEANQAMSLRQEIQTEVQDAQHARDVARNEAAKAKAIRDQARRELNSISAASARVDRSEAQNAKELKETRRQIEKYQSQVAKADALVQKEKERRVELEKHLDTLKNQLHTATQATKNAEQAFSTAQVEAVKLKQKALVTDKDFKAAERDAKQALRAEQSAAEDYRKAAENKRAKLLVVLKKREAQTAAANRKLAGTEKEQRTTEAALTKALRNLRLAKNQSQKTAEKQEFAQAQTRKKLAKAEKTRMEAENSANRAHRQAEQARKAKLAAENATAELERKADMRVAAAAAQVKQIERQRKEAAERLKAAEHNLQKSKENVAEAERGTRQLAKKLADSEKRAQQGVVRTERLAKKLAEAEKKAASAEERADAIEKDLYAAQEVIAAQEQTAISESNVKLTQEEARLKRLAELKGEKFVLKRPKTTPVAAKAKAAPPMIEDIQFLNEDNVQKIVIKANRRLEYSVATDADGNASMELTNVALAPMLERVLDVTDFGGSVESVSSYREKNAVRIEVDIERTAKNEIERSPNTIEWTFIPQQSKEPRVHIADKTPQGTKTRTIAREDSRAYAYPFERTAAYTLDSQGRSQRKKRYTGRRIDLDFKDADIHNILRLLADVGQVNIITSDDVKGSVTIRMRNVAWDHALDVILQTKRLGMQRDQNLIRVAPLTVLEKEREMEIERRKQNMELEPLETRIIPISYAKADELQPRASDLMTERGNISVDARTNVIIARDTRNALDQIEALIGTLDTQTPQVLIESRVVEAATTYAREIGIQWGGDFSASSATGNPTGLAFPSSVGVAGGATDSQTPTAGLAPTPTGQPNPNFGVNLPAAVGTGSGGALGITLGSIANNANLSIRLSSMEESGSLRILSSPKILTLDNREASIEQGTSIPYSVVSAQGVQTAFKDATLSLVVTPHVTADGSILMEIEIQRDEPDFNNTGARGDPTILKRKAETELLVSDGHTAVIGGIFTRNHGTAYKKVPFFADIPILGWLFKSKSDSDRRSEMLIFITPRIVNRAESIGQ